MVLGTRLLNRFISLPKHFRHSYREAGTSITTLRRFEDHLSTIDRVLGNGGLDSMGTIRQAPPPRSHLLPHEGKLLQQITGGKSDNTASGELEATPRT